MMNGSESPPSGEGEKVSRSGGLGYGRRVAECGVRGAPAGQVSRRGGGRLLGGRVGCDTRGERGSPPAAPPACGRIPVPC